MEPPRFDASNSFFLLAVIVSCRYCFISFSNRPAVTVSFCKFVVSFFSRPAVIVSFHFPIVQSFFNRPVQKNKDFAIAGIRTINLRVSRRILTPGTTMPRLRLDSLFVRWVSNICHNVIMQSRFSIHSLSGLRPRFPNEYAETSNETWNCISTCVSFYFHLSKCIASVHLFYMIRERDHI